MLRRASVCFQATLRPYQAALEAVKLGNRGLLAALELFQEFQHFYHERAECRQRSSSVSQAGLIPSSTLCPLTTFCGEGNDVEPFVVLLMKVLCDLKKMEEVRFLFHQFLKEVRVGAPPSTEIFNVYLSAIALTDTFHEQEVEQVEQAMLTHGVEPNVVTKVSLFVLHLRLGHETAASWPALREEVQCIVQNKEAKLYPLLELQLLHCFQVLFRLHHDVQMVHDAFQLVRAVNPTRLTPELMVPYMILSVANNSTPPCVVMEVLELLEAENALRTGATPPLHSEVTFFRLLAKCAAHGDVESLLYLESYLQRCTAQGFRLVSPENNSMLALLSVQTYTRAGRLVDALAAAERVTPLEPGESPKLFLQNRRVALATSDPISDLLHAMSANGVEGLADLMEQLGITSSDGDLSKQRPSSAALEMLLAAASNISEYELCAFLLQKFDSMHLPATNFAFASYISSCLPCRPSLAVRRVRHAMTVMRERSLAFRTTFIRAAMEAALTAGDVPLALEVAEDSKGLEVKHGMRLVKCAAASGDVELVRRCKEALRVCRAPVDPSSEAVFKAFQLS